jgi:hypothetical protein
MIPITTFKVLDYETQTFTHNHIEKDWKPTPTIKSKLQQKTWRSQRFIGQRAYLVQDVVVLANPVFHLYDIDNVC